jgi:hypothetical protein
VEAVAPIVCQVWDDELFEVLECMAVIKDEIEPVIR